MADFEKFLNMQKSELMKLITPEAVLSCIEANREEYEEFLKQEGNTYGKEND